MKIIKLLLKNLVTASFTLLKGFVVKLIEVVGNSFLELAKRVINIISAPCYDGGGNLTNGPFYRRFLLLISNYR